MKTEEWLENELDELLSASKAYGDKALFLAIKELAYELETRVEQLEGKLDGALWSPRDW